jgi:hypothetical protein
MPSQKSLKSQLPLQSQLLLWGQLSLWGQLPLQSLSLLQSQLPLRSQLPVRCNVTALVVILQQHQRYFFTVQAGNKWEALVQHWMDIVTAGTAG